MQSQRYRTKRVSDTFSDPVNQVEEGTKLEFTPEQSLNLWKTVILIAVSVCLGIYFLLVCVKADDRSTFNHLYIFILCLAGHLGAFAFFITHYLSRRVTDQVAFTSGLGMVATLGSFLTQLLLALKMDLVLADITYTIASIPFMVSLIAVSVLYGVHDSNWYLAE